MTTTAIAPAVRDGMNEQQLLDAATRSLAAARSAEVELAVVVLEWATTHPPLDRADRCCVRLPRLSGRDEVVPLNGEGVPEVSAVAVAELGVVLGLSPESGRRLVADVLELAFRLPGVWERVLDGRLLLWQARRVATSTHPLAPRAARFVDRQLAVVAGWVGMRQLERLVVEATARYDLALRVEQIAREVDPRRLDIDLDLVSLDGRVPVHGLVDLPDAIALDAALAHAASELAALGSTDSLHARRARATGDLAREHLALWGQQPPSGRVVLDSESGRVTPVEHLDGGTCVPGASTGEDAAPGDAGHAVGWNGDGRGDLGAACVGGAVLAGAGATAPTGCRCRPDDGLPVVNGTVRARASRRQVVLHVHLAAATIVGTGTGTGTGAGPVGRVDNGNLPIDAETIRSWCGDPHTRITVQPVIDLNEGVHHAGYEIPGRLREQVIARDVTCVFPGCQVPARSCDLDHIDPYDHDDPGAGGQTETANLAALCRRHHNLKTAGRVSYRMTSPGSYEWQFPAGTRATRDLRGTRLLLDPPDP